MLDQVKLEHILFLDIETVPQNQSFEGLNDTMKALWEKKSATFKKEADESPAQLYHRAGIYAEFGKIVCISVGFIKQEQKLNILRIKSFYGKEEKKLLADFSALLETFYGKKESLLCAHNGKEFDFPYIARRMVINGLKLPLLLDIAGKKPWEVSLLDTMDLWRFGDYKNYTSLDLLAAVLGIPTPKDDIDGAMVGSVYWEEKNLKRIVDYCQKDVITVTKIILKYKGEPGLEANQIYFSDI
jgi:DNA polymerase elongation subunit (family B)